MENTLYERIAASFDRLAESGGRCLLVSLVVTLVVFGVASCAWVPNGVYDDWSISNALSANWGQDEGLCLFLNALLCRLIFWLNSAFTSVNWFFVVERLSAFAAYLAVVYLSLRHLRFPFSAVTFFAATVLALPGCTYESNFTYVAGMLVGAGGLALLCSLGKDRHAPSLVVAGIVFMAAGALFRWTMFVLSVPLFGIAALFVLFRERNDGMEAGRRLVRLWPFALALVCFAGLYFYNDSAWQEQPWSEWYEFNEARSDIADYTYASYDDVADELSALGVSRNDYRMLKSWITEDPEFFTVEKLEAIRDVVTGQRADVSRLASAVPSFFVDIVSSLRFDGLIVALLAAVLACARGRGRVAALAVMFVALVVCWALFAFGRMPARVFLPAWLFTALAASMLAGMREPAAGFRRTRMASHAAISWPTRLIGPCLAVLPVVAIAFIMAFSVTHIRIDRLEALFAEDSFNPGGYVYDYIESHDDEVFVLDIPSSAVLIYANLMIAPFDADTVNHTSSVGGWAAHAPYATARNVRIDMKSPIRGLVENDRARLLTRGADTADMLLAYLQEHGYPDASCEVVDVIKEPSSSSKMNVYEFSKGTSG